MKKYKKLIVIASILLLIIAGCSSNSGKRIDNQDKIKKIEPISEMLFGSQYANINQNKLSTWCEKNCAVIMFVSYDIYNQLKEKINRFANDVSQDIKAPVYIELFDIDDKPGNIRKKIFDIHNQRNVQGVILFDAPILLTSFIAPGGGTTLGAYDSCYTDVIYDYSFIRTSRGYICKYNNLKSGSTTSTEMWYSRILPPGENKIEQLSLYLDRNHAYRTGALNFNRGSLVYSDQEFVLGSDNPNLLTLYFGGKDTLFKDSEIELFRSTKENTMRESYLNALKNSNELVIINQHGSPSTHFYDISLNDIKDIKPNSLGYLFYSCSVGGFQEDDYLAGRYIFSGNGLVAIAHSTPILTNVGPTGLVTKAEDATPYKLFTLLQHGASFGESWMFSYGSISGSLLGDPTLRIREKKIADVRLEQDRLNLYSIDKEYEITIWNDDRSDIKNLYHPFTINHPYEFGLIELETHIPGKIKKESNDKIKVILEERNGSFEGRLPLVFVSDNGYSIQFLHITG